MEAPPVWLMVIFLCLAVTLLAQSSITIYTYNKENRTKDLNFYWSCLVLIGSIFGTIASLGLIYMGVKEGAASAEAQVAAAKGQAQNFRTALGSLARVAAATPPEPASGA